MHGEIGLNVPYHVEQKEQKQGTDLVFLPQMVDMSAPLHHRLKLTLVTTGLAQVIPTSFKIGITVANTYDLY